MSNKTYDQLVAEVLAVIFDNNDSSTTTTTGKNLRVLVKDLLDSVPLIGGDGKLISNYLPDGQILTLKTSLSSAQIKSIDSIPIDLIPAPGAGKVIDLISLFTNYTFSIGPYTGLGGNLPTISISENATALASINISLGENSLSKTPIGGSSGSLSDYNENFPISASAPYKLLNGGGSIDFYLAYQIITL